MASEIQGSGDHARSRAIAIGKVIRGFAGFTKFLLFIAVALAVMNWLGDFLHAPLGIKDNPPEPGTLVQLAQFLFWPLCIGFIGFRVLQWCFETYTLVEIAVCGSIFAIWCLTALWVVQNRFHRELIPGSRAIVRIVLPFVLGLLALATNLFLSWAFVRQSRGKGLRYKVGSLFMCISAMIAIFSFAELCKGIRPPYEGYAAVSALLFFVGVGIVPLREIGKSAADTTEASTAHQDGN
jgi:hypothetical protein